jgi:hypothetical protein
MTESTRKMPVRRRSLEEGYVSSAGFDLFQELTQLLGALSNQNPLASKYVTVFAIDSCCLKYYQGATTPLQRNTRMSFAHSRQPFR